MIDLIKRFARKWNKSTTENEPQKNDLEKTKMKEITIKDIINSYTITPRNVLTRKNGVWFYARGDGENIYIESGRGKAHCSKITVRRRLDLNNFDEVYLMYKQGAPRTEVCNVTQNSSYWFGIFADLSD